MKDLMSVINPKRAISPVSVADNTPQVGQVIDRIGYQGLTFIIATGALLDADATFSTLVEESDQSGSGFTAVADADLIGTEAQAGFNFAADDRLFKLGYKGAKRYVRLTLTPAGNASGASLAAIALLSGPASAPTPNPPV